MSTPESTTSATHLLLVVQFRFLLIGQLLSLQFGKGNLLGFCTLTATCDNLKNVRKNATHRTWIFRLNQVHIMFDPVFMNKSPTEPSTQALTLDPSLLRLPENWPCPQHRKRTGLVVDSPSAVEVYGIGYAPRTGMMYIKWPPSMVS